MTTIDSINPARIARTWVRRKFHRSARLGYEIIRSDDLSYRFLLGGALIAYGLMKRRSGPKLIYKTSIDVGEGMAIRVMQGRRPIAATAPIR